MRAALWLIGLFVAAVALALFAGDNEGTVTVFWPPHRVDLSVNLALLLLLLGFALVHAALRAWSALLALPHQARRWRERERERAINTLLLDARIQYTAGRYLRARKAAEAALARTQEDGLGEGEGEMPPARKLPLRTQAHLMAAESAHALQDEITRERHLAAALAAAATPGAAGELRQAVLLRAAHWALNAQDPVAALARLDELPGGARRRTAALRLKLKAQRHSGRIAEAMDTARLLAKHGAFSPLGAASLLRGLAAERIAQAGDLDDMEQVRAALDARERATPELALRAAQRVLALGGDVARVRQWLAPVRDDLLAQSEALTDAQRVRLARVLEATMADSDTTDTEWLARIEGAQRQHPRDAILQYLAGMACLQHGLWGKAQSLLGQAARALDDAGLRRSAWRALARLAEQRGDSAAAASAWREAAQG